MRKTIAITVASLVVGGVAALPAYADDAREVKKDAQATTQRAGEAVDDASLLAKIKSSMLRSPEVEGLDVNVDVKDGVVTLSGSADTQTERSNAEKIARNADGVKRVENRITVKPDEVNSRPALPPVSPAAPPAVPGTPPVLPAPPAN
ncbi:MAG TPA: BON domain-containing protein [Steroidobacteraceae bacterium]|nr:BON domain-containing protein [Steroidobacteraceae bacterium]